MSELRDALEGLIEEAQSHAAGCYGAGALDEAVTKAVAALEAPSEMQQLVEWLEGEKKDHEEWLDREEAIYDMSTKFYQGSRAAYQKTLDHICTEFLGEERADE